MRVRHKGVSELLAAVILVTIVLILATVFYAWSSGQLSKALQAEEMFQNRQIDIKGEDLELTSMALVDAATDYIEIKVQNTGTSDTELTYVTVHFSNGNVYYANQAFIQLERYPCPLNPVVSPCVVCVSPNCGRNANPNLVAGEKDLTFSMRDFDVIRLPYKLVTATSGDNAIGTEDRNLDWVIKPIPFNAQTGGPETVAAETDVNGNTATDTITGIEIGTILGGKYTFTKPTAVIKVTDQYQDADDNIVIVLSGLESSSVDTDLAKWEWRFFCDPDKHGVPLTLHQLTSDAGGAVPLIKYGQTVSFTYNKDAPIYDSGVKITTGNPYILLKVADSRGMVGYVWIRLSNIVIP